MQVRSMVAEAAALGLAGCGGAKAVVNEPSKITLRQALKETVDALYAARYRSASHGGVAIGLNACTFTATFNVTATGTDKQGLVLNVGAPAGAPVTAGLQGSLEATASATRGNTVAVTFTSPACNPADTLGTKLPNEVAHLQWQIGAARYGGYPAAEPAQGRSGVGRPDVRPAAQRLGAGTAGAPTNPSSTPSAEPAASGGIPPSQGRRPWNRPDLFALPPGFRPDISRVVPSQDPILLYPPIGTPGDASAPVRPDGTAAPQAR